MSQRLAVRLKEARQRYFVGRATELALFKSALDEDQLPYYVLYVFGPGGVGKTTLLKEFAELCSLAGIPAFSIDARTIDPSPASFLEALQRALSLVPAVTALEFLTSQASRQVLLLDTYEALAPLDEWIRRDFLPKLPENTLVMLASRFSPSPVWTSDPGWQAVMRVVPLRNLAPTEILSYLQRRNVPEGQHQAVLAFTHGHPLALSLVADVFDQRPGFEFRPEDTPDVVKTLLEQFTQKVPGPAHRAALEACSLVRVTTEALLARMLTTDDAHELFEWLRELTFIESRRGGIFPHDLAREALIADLRWRNPDWYAELHRRARLYYMERLSRTTGTDQLRNLWDYIFLHRDNPVVRPYFEWQASSSVLVDAMRQPDLPLLVEMVRTHEGDESASIAAHWLERFPQGVLILRDNKNLPTGFLSWIELNLTDDPDRQLDPAIRAVWDYVQTNAPLRAGEVAALCRFWMAADTYQAVSPVQSLIFVNLVRYYLTTPGLAYTFLPCAQPDFWEAGFAYGDFQRAPQADFHVGGRVYGVFCHDWRIRPPLAWLDLLAEREIAAAPQEVALVRQTQPLLVLSQEEFRNAVRDALRAFSQPAELAGNPLLRSRVMLEVGASAPEKDDLQKFRSLLVQTAETLRASPRTEKFYCALEKTYFHPAPSQEIAAELLDLPFSTYRRHLKAGINHIIGALWQKEIGHFRPDELTKL